jgi:hypothetical protein
MGQPVLSDIPICCHSAQVRVLVMMIRNARISVSSKLCRALVPYNASHMGTNSTVGVEVISQA